ncbi:S41 family peptidase [Streptomyces sp. NPDC058572]|uniref:S41 family peptidase n=1 Tax=Streptomyces sp. NPDC058572 TaxID=3346546 RepID=UPI00364E1C51
MRRTAITRTTVTAVALALGATLVTGPAPAAAVQDAHVEGVWRSDGYGTVYAIDEGRLREFQTTAAGCLPGATAQRTGSGRRASYTAEDGTVLDVRPGKLRVAGSPGERGLRRLSALPAECTRPAPSGPLATFDVFWQTFEENYPFFAAKGIDWHAVRDRHRPRISGRTTDEELFAVLSDMVRPLYDAHVRITAGKDRFFFEKRPGTEIPGPELDQRVKAHIERRDLGGRPLQEFAGGRIGYADLPGGQGYLRVTGFGGYTDADPETYDDCSAALDRALDAVFTRERTARLKGLIIDLRINGGGSDSLGLRLAGRLTDRTHFAYAKRARNHPSDAARFTHPQPQYVHPARGPRYTGPVAVLTGGSTVSAGETVTQALMDRPGRTVRIGAPTQGVFSDVMPRVLPNGWQLMLPNEEFRTRTGRTFDGPGIPPHLTEPVFTDEEFDRNRDSAFDRAVSVLRLSR